MAEHPDPTPLVETANRILDEANKRNTILRLIGAIAFYIKCPHYNYLQMETGRFFTDVDFMAYTRQKDNIERMFLDLGYLADKRVQAIPGIRRSIFFTPDHHLHSDVFYDVLDFCHEIDFRGRLEMDYPTISLVDLLLEKMQIVELNKKDVTDTIMLLCEYDVGNQDKDMVNIEYLAKLCKADWGLWKTVTNNLDKVSRLIDDYDILGAVDRNRVLERLRRTLQRIDAEPPTLRWRLRSRIGERVKWYRDVDEVV